MRRWINQTYQLLLGSALQTRGINKTTLAASSCMGCCTPTPTTLSSLGHAGAMRGNVQSLFRDHESAQ
jgi:hypothetical protein